MSIKCNVLSESNIALDVTHIAKEFIKILNHTGNDFSGPLFAVGNKLLQDHINNGDDMHIIEVYVKIIISHIVRHTSFTTFVEDVLNASITKSISTSCSVTGSMHELMSAIQGAFVAAITMQRPSFDSAALCESIESNETIRTIMTRVANTIASDIKAINKSFAISDNDFFGSVQATFDKIIQSDKHSDYSFIDYARLYFPPKDTNDGVANAVINTYEKLFVDLLVGAYETAGGISSIEVDDDYAAFSFSGMRDNKQTNVMNDYMKAAGHFNKNLSTYIDIIKKELTSSDFHGNIHNAIINVINGYFKQIKVSNITSVLHDADVADEITRNAAKSFSPKDIGDIICDVYMKTYVDDKIGSADVNATLRNMFRDALTSIEDTLYGNMCIAIHKSFADNPAIIESLTKRLNDLVLEDFLDYFTEFEEYIYGNYATEISEALCRYIRIGLIHAVEIINQHIDKVLICELPDHSVIGSQPTVDTFHI